MTVGDLWTSTRHLTSSRVLDLLHRALQNERANQCVSGSYHTGDVNEKGYEACVALLDIARRVVRVTYGRLPAHLKARSVASRKCGCMAVCRGPCKMVNGLCVPRNRRASGFETVLSIPNQRERTQNRVQVRRRSRSPRGRDPDTQADRRAGHRDLTYVEDGPVMWRRPSPRVRVPLR